MVINLFTLFSLVIISTVQGQELDSPCPDVLRYETRNYDRWYGVITLISPVDVKGITLHIVLDRSAEALVMNWVAETDSKDNIIFIISTPSYTLAAGVTLRLNFFVKHDTNYPITVPTVKQIYFNGKEICPSKPTNFTDNPILQISKSIIAPDAQSAYPERPPSYSDYEPITSTSTSTSRPIEWSSTTVDEDVVTDSREENIGLIPPLTSCSTCPPSQSEYSAPIYDPDQPPSYSDYESRTNTSTSTSRPIEWSHTTVDDDVATDSRKENMIKDSSTNEPKPTEDDQFFSGDFHVVSSKKPTSRPLTVAKEPIQCGTVAQRANPLISHGQKTTPGQWPWHIALYRLKGIELIYTCGGTLISERFIVTAAHCVTKPKSNKHVDKEYLVVYLGKYSLINFNNDVQTREVEQIIVHPGYNYTVFYNDIAVLKLDTEAEFNNFVRPCCLWDDTDSNDIENLIGQHGTVIGWGFDENQRLSKTLMQAQMPILSTNTCLFSNRDFFAHFIFDTNFCAGFTNGTSVCNGDSGGGMVIKKFSARGHNVLWQLRGIVSVGVALQGQGVCDTKQFTIFTDAGKYVLWINEILQQT